MKEWSVRQRPRKRTESQLNKKQVLRKIRRLKRNYLSCLLTCVLLISFKSPPHESRKNQIQAFLNHKFSPDSISIKKISSFNPVILFNDPDKSEIVKEMRKVEDSIQNDLAYLIERNKEQIEHNPSLYKWIRNDLSKIQKNRPLSSFVSYFMYHLKPQYSILLNELYPFLSESGEKEIVFYRDKFAKEYSDISLKIKKSIKGQEYCYKELFENSNEIYVVDFNRNKTILEAIIWADFKCHLYCLVTEPQEYIRK